MVKHPVKLLLWLVLGLAMVGWLIFWRPENKPKLLSKSELAPIQEMTEPSPSPEPILTGISPDGKVALKMKPIKGAGTITWTLTAKKDEVELGTIWWQTLPQDIEMSIPFNTVSPDNNYLFLKQNQRGKNRYLVLRVDGQPITEDDQAVEFAEVFESQYPEYKITEVTGWGGINLVVFNTDKVEGGLGPSFWYEVPSGAFIRLSNRFE